MGADPELVALKPLCARSIEHGDVIPYVTEVPDMRKGLLAETVIIGASAAAAGQALKMAGLTTGKPAFWFGIGALTHIGWEATGGNRWYVENRDAADFPKGLLG